MKMKHEITTSPHLSNWKLWKSTRRDDDQYEPKEWLWNNYHHISISNNIIDEIIKKIEDCVSLIPLRAPSSKLSTRSGNYKKVAITHPIVEIMALTYFSHGTSLLFSWTRNLITIAIMSKDYNDHYNIPQIMSSFNSLRNTRVSMNQNEKAMVHIPLPILQMNKKKVNFSQIKMNVCAVPH